MLTDFMYAINNNHKQVIECLWISVSNKVNTILSAQLEDVFKIYNDFKLKFYQFL